MTAFATPPALPLTPVQLRTLEFVAEYIDRCGYAPSLAEIAGEFGRARETIWYVLGELERRGMLTRERYKARRTVLTDAGRALCAPRCCPHCGRAV